MAVGISGAVVVRDDGRGNIQYRPKCEHCGRVDSTTVSTSVSPGSTLTCGNHYCIECKQRTPIEIQG
ncbi:MAG: hypothetical protein K2P78_13430 [Gemmataceae bacterium]|nr:hypothetical protein [Gemmataceae bacterium]